MAQVSEKVLSWLYSVLHEYQDSRRTYSDTARALSAFTSLSPRTDVYAYENGSSALLLNLSGTLPVTFRGALYRFPVKIWIPHFYPREAPMAYIIPGEDVLVRPGQHVGVDGRVYHPYLRDWARMWDRANIAEFLESLQHVFGKEPPVISRTQQQQHQRQMGASARQQISGSSQSSPPQLPPKPGAGDVIRSDGLTQNKPPPLPPKPGEEYADRPREVSRDVSRDGPPLPPLPRELADQQIRTVQAVAEDRDWQSPWQPPRTHSQTLHAPAPAYQNDRLQGPSQPSSNAYQYPPPTTQQHVFHERSPVSPVFPIPGYSQPPNAKYSSPAALPESHVSPQVGVSGSFPSSQQSLQQVQTQHATNPSHIPPQLSQSGPSFREPNVPPLLQTKPQPLDLLSDPFDIALGNPSGSAPPAPPIPPNPERDQLLQAISETLVEQAQHKVNQNLSAILPLQSQQHALRAAHARLESEVRQLEQLDQALSSNEAILHRSIRDCDHTINTAKSKKQPPIDDVLIAPTMVANQLWTLCAEEAACRETMYVLQKAVDKGRISGNDFVRQMRGLGRECFLKMALARKCARGMDLDLRR